MTATSRPSTMVKATAVAPPPEPQQRPARLPGRSSAPSRGRWSPRRCAPHRRHAQGEHVAGLRPEGDLAARRQVGQPRRRSRNRRRSPRHAPRPPTRCSARSPGAPGRSRPRSSGRTAGSCRRGPAETTTGRESSVPAATDSTSPLWPPKGAPIGCPNRASTGRLIGATVTTGLGAGSGRKETAPRPDQHERRRRSAPSGGGRSAPPPGGPRRGRGRASRAGRPPWGGRRGPWPGPTDTVSRKRDGTYDRSGSRVMMRFITAGMLSLPNAGRPVAAKVIVTPHEKTSDGGPGRRPASLLGRHVGGGALHAAGLGPGGVHDLGDAEVDDAGAVGAEQDVGRFEVAVDDARLVDRGQRGGRADGQAVERTGVARALASDQGLQGLAVDVFADDEGAFAGDVGVDDAGGAELGDLTRGGDLVVEVALAEDAGVEDFDGDGARPFRCDRGRRCPGRLRR